MLFYLDRSLFVAYLGRNSKFLREAWSFKKIFSSKSRITLLKSITNTNNNNNKNSTIWNLIQSHLDLYIEFEILEILDALTDFFNNKNKYKSETGRQSSQVRTHTRQVQTIMLINFFKVLEFNRCLFIYFYNSKIILYYI